MRQPSRQAARLPPITPERIIVELTRAHGINGWTIRRLAAALEVWPRVIGYHVGDREAVVHGAVAHVVAANTAFMLVAAKTNEPTFPKLALSTTSSSLPTATTTPIPACRRRAVGKRTLA